MAKDSRKSSRSSKTDRVLGLLTDPTPVLDSGDGNTPKPQPQTKATDDRVTQAQIRDALSDALSEEVSAPPPRRAPVRTPPPPPPEPEPEPDPVPEDDFVPFVPEELPPEPAPVPPPPPEPEPVYRKERPEPAYARNPGVMYAQEQAYAESRAARPAEPAAPPPPPPEPEPPVRRDNIRIGQARPRLDDYFYYNIAQSLVEAKVDQYIRTTGMCRCERCRRDVVALALTNLPPKYVVTKNVDLVPRLSIYENKYATDITTQVLNACRRVAGNPHHDRD